MAASDVRPVIPPLPPTMDFPPPFSMSTPQVPLSAPVVSARPSQRLRWNAPTQAPVQPIKYSIPPQPFILPTIPSYAPTYESFLPTSHSGRGPLPPSGARERRRRWSRGAKHNDATPPISVQIPALHSNTLPTYPPYTPAYPLSSASPARPPYLYGRARA